MTIYVGTSGWSYAHWEGVLYPPHLPVHDRLDYYLPRYNTVEVNSSFYHWPPDKTFVRWQERLPGGFLFTVKAPRGLTHAARLYSPEKWLDTIRRGMQCLQTNGGILLVQLPPALASDLARLTYFLACLPTGLKVAIEFRHPSWQQEAVFSLLEQYNVAYCVMSGAHLPCVLRATASFVYVRMHGPHPASLYAGSYSNQDLAWWKDRIGEWNAMGKDVFVYFNNDGEGNAVRNADTLKQMLMPLK
jgi:uncharacterized protein YecE (DUF72 family)